MLLLALRCGRLLIFLVVALILGAQPVRATVPTELPLPTTKQSAAVTMMGMPLHFEANQGQVDDQVKFLARGKGYALFLTPTESVMVLQQREGVKRTASNGSTRPLGHNEAAPWTQSIVRMKLEGANPSPDVQGVEKLPGIVNYFIGNDLTKWRTEIPTYARVQYDEVYPGISLAYYGNHGKLEYDFIVSPGGNPGQIKLVFEGTTGIRLSENGDLILSTSLGEVQLQKPIVYQLETNGHKTLVAGDYLASPNSPKEVRIQLAAYDHSKLLVIDPVLLFSTHLGGNGNDAGMAIGVDTANNIYVAGITTSTDFPALNAAQANRAGGSTDIIDVFVTKLNSTGGLVYSTYLGGSGADGIGFEYGFPTVFGESYAGGGLAVDAPGNAYVAGSTQSTNFPTLNAYQVSNGGPGAQQISDDAFLAKLSPTGGLLYSTYLGGASSDYGFDVAVDSQQNAYLTGQTGDAAFPVYNTRYFAINNNLSLHATDIFVAKFNATGGLLYSRFFGAGYGEYAPSIAADAVGNVYLTGQTGSDLLFSTVGADQQAFGGDHDAFVAKLDTAGETLWTTYLGGGGRENGNDIALDTTGNVYVTGRTTSLNFPILNANQPNRGGVSIISDGFVAKYTSAGTRLYSTYLGGSGEDLGAGIVADGNGNAYITGLTSSTDFPTSNAIQAAHGGGLSDAFITKYNANGILSYSTYLGGDHTDKGWGIGIDAAGNAYMTGETSSSNFPLVNPNLPSTGGINAFIARLGEPTSNNNPPVCTSAQPSVSSLWKADRTMVPVSILGVTDPNNDPITITYPAVTQDEPISGLDRRDVSPDAAVSGQQILLRAERDQKEDGRVYVVHFTATDSQNGSCSGTVRVEVPLNKRFPTAVDSGQNYNSFGP